MHELSCEKYIFFHRYGHFLDFIYKLIILYNKKNNKNKYARFAKEKKYFIKNEKLKNCKNEEEIKQVEKEFKQDKNLNDNIKKEMKNIISEMQKKKEKNEISKKYTFNIKYINTFNYINK